MTNPLTHAATYAAGDAKAQTVTWHCICGESGTPTADEAQDAARPWPGYSAATRAYAEHVTEATADREADLRALVADWEQRAAEMSVERDETVHDPNAEIDDAIADTYMDLAKALAAVLDGES